MKRFIAEFTPLQRWLLYAGYVIAPVTAIWMLILGEYVIAAFFIVIMGFPWLMSRLWAKANPEPPDHPGSN